MLGLPDVGMLTMAENVDRAGRIAGAVDVPLVADMDTGYGNVLNVRRTMQECVDAGIAGVIFTPGHGFVRGVRGRHRRRVLPGTRAGVRRPGVRVTRRLGDRGTTSLGRVIRGPGVRLFAMANGKVDFFNDTGGYGFISTEDADEDVFFHMEDVGGPDLEEGESIEFDIEQAPKGPRATNVVRA
jgi:CspA family cold shock protein